VLYILDFLVFLSSFIPLHPRQMCASMPAELMPHVCGLMTGFPARNAPRGKAFGHAVVEGTMAQGGGGLNPAERGIGIFVLIIATP